MSVTTWVDVSDLLDWQGRATGIQRTAYELSKRFYADKKSHIRFVRFDGAKAKFVEVDYQKAMKTYQDNTAAEANHQFVKSSKGTVKKAYRRYVPLSLQRQTRRSKGIVKNLSNKKPVHDIETVIFSSGDILFVAGSNWDNFPMWNYIKKLAVDHDVSYVQILYDMVPLAKPKLIHPDAHVHFSKYVSFLSGYSQNVLAISESTKKDFLKFGKADADHVSVIRLGEDFASTAKPARPSTIKPKEEFVLTVGTIEIRKNHKLIIDAIRLGIKTNKQLPKLVIAGQRGWLTSDLLASIKSDSELQDRVIVLDDISDGELSWCYQNSMYTVFPSLYEGWGLPVSESLAKGKLCLSSDSSSLPEIAGELIEYFSPDDPKKLHELMYKYASNPKALAEREEAIKKNYTPTTWKDTYSQVAKQLKVIERTAKA